MTNKNIEQAAQIVGGLAKKVFESAIHAAIFAFVSKKTSNWMTKQEEKACKEKVRVSEDAEIKVSLPEKSTETV